MKNGVFENFAKIHRKTPVPRVIFNKVAGLRPETATHILRNFAKFLRTPFFLNKFTCGI